MIAWLVFLSGNTGSDRVIDRKLSTVAVAVGGALIGEILMGGITYTLYFNGASNDLLLRSLNSPWFIVPMTVEAGISYALNKRNGGLLSKIAPLWIINMLFNPPIMMGSYWFELSLSASAIIMTITIIIMLDYLHRHKVIHDHDIHVFVGASIVMAIMMLVQLLAYIGFIPWISYGAAVLVDMAWYFVVYLNDDLMGGRTSWLTKPVILALSLSAIFVAEAAMGGVISMEAGWLDVIQLKSLLNPPISVIGSIEFISSLSLSPGFLIMMGGIEMGWLVAAKMSESRNLENKVRMIMMMMAYVLYSIYIPSFLPTVGKISLFGLEHGSWHCWTPPCSLAFNSCVGHLCHKWHPVIPFRIKTGLFPNVFRSLYVARHIL